MKTITPKDTIAELTALLSQAIDIVRNHGAEDDADFLHKQMENAIQYYKKQDKKQPKEILIEIENELRGMRDSDVNPCKDEDAVGLCPCHTFDKAIDGIENLQNLIAVKNK